MSEPEARSSSAHRLTRISSGLFRNAGPAERHDSCQPRAQASLEEIGDYVGHSSSYMTDRYRHLIDGARADAAAALDALLASG
jgi:hypothetical protein